MSCEKPDITFPGKRTKDLLAWKSRCKSVKPAPKREWKEDPDKYPVVDMTPIILNEDSNFVVVTYWWGRGRTNLNLQYPCPEDIKEAAADGVELKIKKPAITYDQMIDKWEKSLSSKKINYMAVEYATFARPGYYQNAINFKPYFIEEALRACYPRGVLYIDGDMFVKKYPKLLEIPNIDFAGRSWNSDLDPYNSDVACFDPFVFETSGGTLFFGQTTLGYDLLKLWQEGVEKHKGKAEDRTISLIVNNKKLLTYLNMLQLPIEYLWLTQTYDDELNETEIRLKNKMFIEHPDCLTGEERAIEMSDEALKKAKSRIPYKYDYYVTNQVECERDYNIFYEYIYFPDRMIAENHDSYLRWLEDYGASDVVEYDDYYGDQNDIAYNNTDLAKGVKRVFSSPLVHVTNFEDEDSHYVSTKKMLIPTILSYLSNGQSVLYVPEGSTRQQVNKVKNMIKTTPAEFIVKNTNTSDKHYKKDYLLKINPNYPMFFNADSIVLFHLLMMSDNFSSIASNFNQSANFLTRIRCYWL